MKPSPIEVLTSIAALRDWRTQAQTPVAFVPTMGNLHDGHLLLCEAAKAWVAPSKERACGRVIVSIFVNPLQFGPTEDFAAYPRTFEADCAKLAAIGVDAVFHPEVTTLYPHGAQQYFVEPPALQNALCGQFRPGHFRGVATVVNKLFNLVQPHCAVFGKKDYQQIKIIEGMVADLDMPVHILPVDTQRASDGLALSSRNNYLTKAERAEAPRLYQQLQSIKQAITSGEKNWAMLMDRAKVYLTSHGWRVDYVQLCEQHQLEIAKPDDKRLVVLAAAYLGKTRLIDNVEINL